VKKKFIDEPGQMKLLIVVDKLLTGFDAPSATYLYIDKKMQDHGLFQAICRVNRLDGRVPRSTAMSVDYKDLFKRLEGAVQDYTSGALDGFDAEDVEGLLGGPRWARPARPGGCAGGCEGAVRAGRPSPRFSGLPALFLRPESGNAAQLKENEPKRLKLYKFTASLLRAYAAIASELAEAGYSEIEIWPPSRRRWTTTPKCADEVKLSSGDYIDLKAYEPAMRHLIDTYIRASDSEKISSFDDLTLIQLLVERRRGCRGCAAEGHQAKRRGGGGDD